VSALVLGMVLGAVLQYALPRAWKEATEADRREQLRARPAGRSAVDRPAQMIATTRYHAHRQDRHLVCARRAAPAWRDLVAPGRAPHRARRPAHRALRRLHRSEHGARAARRRRAGRVGSHARAAAARHGARRGREPGPCSFKAAADPRRDPRGRRDGEGLQAGLDRRLQARRGAVRHRARALRLRAELGADGRRREVREAGRGPGVAYARRYGRLRHLAVTGRRRSRARRRRSRRSSPAPACTALAFVTKRGEGAFADGRRVQPYFRDRADWQFVTSIIDATLQEKNKFLRPWIMKICRTTRTLADVQREVREGAQEGEGDQRGRLHAARRVPRSDRAGDPARRAGAELDLAPGAQRDGRERLRDADADAVRAVGDRLGERARARNTIVVVPEAWEFIPRARARR
jgi:hypothetical protein